MTKSWQGLVALGVAVGMSGCARIQTRVVELPRVDQEVAGNQGYLQGKGVPARPPRRATRQVLMTDLELMTGPEIKQGLRDVVQMSTTPVKGELGPNGRGWKVAEPSVPAPTAAISGSSEEAVPLTQARPAPVPPPASVEELGLPPMASSAPAPQMTPPPPSVAPAPTVTSYTVQKGDTLEKIAKKVYGESRRWPKIYKANRDVIKNPNKLYPGQRLTIPALPSD